MNHLYTIRLRRMIMNKAGFHRAFFFLSPSQLVKCLFITTLGELWATCMCLVCQGEIGLIKLKSLTSARPALELWQQNQKFNQGAEVSPYPACCSAVVELITACRGTGSTGNSSVVPDIERWAGAMKGVHLRCLFVFLSVDVLSNWAY